MITWVSGSGGMGQQMTEEEYRQYMLDQHLKRLAQYAMTPQQFAASYGTHSGGSIYGGHRQAGAQAYGNSISQSNLGSQQLASQAQLAQLAYQQALAQQGFAGLPTNVTGTAGIAYRAEPAEPLEDAGISVGEIIAIRVWRYIPASGLLQSMAVDCIWAPAEPMQGDPESWYGNGVHAFKSQTEALSQYRAGGGGAMVVGTAMLWGTVIEHEKGYRAEFGKVNTLDFITNMVWWKERRALQRLRARYGV